MSRQKPKLIEEVYFKVPDYKTPRTMHFYEWDNKYFRDFLFLETHEEAQEAIKSKWGIYESHEENMENFLEICKDKNATTITEEELITIKNLMKIF